jgi:hypothetical protein
MQTNRFRVLLPLAQCPLAALFGGLGLWQRSVILSRPGFFDGTTMWDTTARFHVWPWPYKFAVISNFPAFLAGSLLLWPVGLVWPKVPEPVEAVPALLFVLILWYWVGLRFDRRWSVKDKSPWPALSAFCLVSVAGAFLRIGYVDFLPYGFALWAITALSISRFTRVCTGIPMPYLRGKAITLTENCPPPVRVNWSI